jgi:GNAT superfamily N-acetyltransferase
MTNVELYAGELTDDISAVADNYEFKPYFYVSAASDESLNRVFRERLAKFLSKCAGLPDKFGFLLARDETGKVAGFCGVEVLDFDTAVLGTPSGKIAFCAIAPSVNPGSLRFSSELSHHEAYIEARPVADALISAALAWLDKRGVVFTNARTAAVELPLIHALEKAGFYLIDNGITAFYHKDNAPKYEKSGYDIRLFAGKDLPVVLEIMRGAYAQDRFHLDSRIPYVAAEQLYQLWIEHSATNPKDQEWVLIAERSGVVKGFFQYQYEREFSEATGIGLFSYGPAAVVRDRTALGAYYSLLSFAVNDSIMRGGTYAMTRIPFGIQPILKLTLRLGPSFMTNDLTFHRWGK